jgi:hypothetical protein
LLDAASGSELDSSINPSNDYQNTLVAFRGPLMAFRRIEGYDSQPELQIWNIIA